MKLHYTIVCALYITMSLHGVVPPAYYPSKYNPYIYPPHMHQYSPDNLYNKKEPVLLQQPINGNNYEHFSSMISALLLGAGSGYLCKSCEPRALHECFLLHIVYLTMWGVCENSFMDIWVADLTAHDIKHNPSLMKHVAWVMSWISYLI